mgnify:CR=1 FL=1
MSAVPPNLVGPVLQSHLTQRQVQNVRSSEENQKASAAQRGGMATEEKDTTVETTDNDTQVYTDSEGTGSQGRAFSEPESQEEEASDKKKPVEGDEGTLIDVEA